jgi:DNA transposition AAA+ family ATPase
MSDFVEEVGTAPEDLRQQVRTLVDGGMSQADLARETGIKYGTFTLWFSGKYTGDNARLDEMVGRYLASREARATARRTLPAAPKWVDTPTSETFIAALEYGQFACDIVAVSGAAGVGKTTACVRYQATHPNVWLMTAQPVTSTPNFAMRELARTMSITERSAGERAGLIISRVRDTGGLIIVDEAQHLSSAAIDQLRSVHDAAEIGLALVGNSIVRERLGGSSPQLAQLHSRVGMRVKRDRPLNADIGALLQAWGIDGKNEQRLLMLIGKKPGALRGLTKVLRVASMLAAGAPIAEAHITTAWSRISEQQLAGDAQ